MRTRAIMLVLLLAAAVLVYVPRLRDHEATNPAVYRHYFAIGKRVCQAPKPTPIDGITVWSGFAQGTIHVAEGTPAEIRRALIAGCDAAAG